MWCGVQGGWGGGCVWGQNSGGCVMVVLGWWEWYSWGGWVCVGAKQWRGCDGRVGVVGVV